MLFSIGKRAAASDLVELLLECHTRIRTFTQLAVAVAEHDAPTEAEVLDACQRYERYFTQALPLHVQDEELSLQPRLAGIGRDLDDALAEMQRQHETHGPILAELHAATRALVAAPSESRERVGSAASKLAAEFDAHLALEERIVFPAIRTWLPARVQEQLMAEFRARRGGSGEHM